MHNKKSIVKILITISILCIAMLLSVSCTKHVHEYTQYIVSPTCESQGFTLNVCECGDTYNSDYVDAKHTYALWKTYAPNCETKGYDLYRCECGEEYRNYNAKALGHDFGEYISDNNATYQKDGTKTAKCKREGCNVKNTVVDSGSKLKYSVVFYYGFNNLVDLKYVESGKPVSQPVDPYKQNYLFVGWYADESLNIKYDFSKPVTKHTKIYAKYELDAATLTNKISTDIIKGVVKVYSTSYNSFLGIKYEESSGQGSGFCFYSNNGYYYILTNCHVAIKESGYDNQEFIIEDYQGKTYTGYLYKNPNKSKSAIDPAYDLACLYFKASSTNVKALSFGSANPEENDDIILLGTPKGQQNAITYGKVNCYKTVKLSAPAYETNVLFPIIASTAYANSGSSGGPALNSDLQIVGVHFGSSHDRTNSYQIPLSKIKEFLNKYFYN